MEWSRQNVRESGLAGDERIFMVAEIHHHPGFQDAVCPRGCWLSCNRHPMEASGPIVEFSIVALS